MSGIIDFIAGMAGGGQNQDTGAPTTGIGARLLNGVKAMDEGYANYAADATKAKALRQVVAAYAQDEPDPDKQKNIVNFSHTAGLGDLEGFVAGHAALQGAHKAAADIGLEQAQTQEAQARGGLYKGQEDWRQSQADSAKNVGSFLQNFMTAPKVPGDDPDDDPKDMPFNDRLNYAAQKTPNMSANDWGPVMDSLSRWQAANPTEKDTGFDEDPITGARFAHRGNTFMPSGYDPAKAPATPDFSPDGRFFYTKNGWKQVSDLGFPEGSTIKTVNGVNAVVGPDGRILKTVGAVSPGQALISALAGGEGMNAAPTNAPPPIQSQPQPQRAGTNEIMRVTRDGKKVIYDATTKKPLRYAN